MVPNPANLQEFKRLTSENIGWVYQHMPWLTTDEAQAAEKNRQALLNDIKYRIDETASGTKLFIGVLSPGCHHCADGTWGCCFIGTACTRQCFFCPNPYVKESEALPRLNGVLLESPEDHVNMIRQLGIRGSAFSGGEPFLYLDRLLAHVRAIRQAFGEDIYIWVYTNGDPVTADALKQVKDAGVTEIRFDLAASRYDLTAVKLAREIMPTVSVEIPAIPEDEALVTELLPVLAQIGVDHLNIHQMFANKTNYRNLMKRDYHFVHFDVPPIFESELMALRLLKFTLDEHLNLSVHYCSHIYKHHFQAMGDRKQFLKAFPQLKPMISPIGFVRLLNVRGKEEVIEKLVARLRKADKEGLYWQTNDLKQVVWMSTHLWEAIDWSNTNVRIRYFMPELILSPEPDLKPVAFILEKYNPIFFTNVWTGFVFKQWYRRYVENSADSKDVAKQFAQNFPINSRSDLHLMRAYQEEVLETVKAFEEISYGLAPIF